MLKKQMISQGRYILAILVGYLVLFGAQKAHLSLINISLLVVSTQILILVLTKQWSVK